MTSPEETKGVEGLGRGSNYAILSLLKDFRVWKRWDILLKEHHRFVQAVRSRLIGLLDMNHMVLGEL